MVPSSRQRQLGSFERAQALTGERFPYNLVAVIGLDGTLDPDRLRRALDGIQRRHPLLRAQIAGHGRRAVFRLGGTPPLPLRRIAARDWRGPVEEELGSRFDVERGPLARCLYIAPPGGAGQGAGEIVLTFHHVIADGVGVGRLVQDLLLLCGPGPHPSPAPAALPPSADERFPLAFRRAGGGFAGLRFLLRQAAEEAAFRWRRRRRPARPAATASACRILTTALPPAETAALVRASRRHRVSLTAALEAAMLLAVSKCRYRGERLPHRYMVFPLLRPYLEPPVDETLFGSYLSILRLTLEVGGDDRLWAVAAAITRQVYAAAKRGEKFLASVWSPLSIKMVLGQTGARMGATALSYTGPIDLESDWPSSADGPRVREVHAFVSNFPVGPEYTAQARIYRKRLVWDVVYLDADMTAEQARKIARRMKAVLVAAAPLQETGP